MATYFIRLVKRVLSIELPSKLKYYVIYCNCKWLPTYCLEANHTLHGRSDYRKGHRKDDHPRTCLPHLQMVKSLASYLLIIQKNLLSAMIEYNFKLPECRTKRKQGEIEKVRHPKSNTTETVRSLLQGNTRVGEEGCRQKKGVIILAKFQIFSVFPLCVLRAQSVTIY